MIRYDGGSMRSVICGLKGSVIKVVWPWVLVTAVLAVLAAMLKVRMKEDYVVTVTQPWGVVGGCLSFLLVFRTNISYGRYWTAQTSLDSITQNARELMSLTVVFTGDYSRGDDGNIIQQNDPFMAECRGEIHRLLLALVFFMVMNLKRLGDTAEMTKAMLEEDIGWLAHAKLLSQKEASFLKKTDVHKGACVTTNVIATFLRQRLQMMADLHGKGSTGQTKITNADFERSDVMQILPMMNGIIASMLDSWSACGTIGEVPLVFAYNQMLAICLVFWTFTIPFPIANELYQGDTPGLEIGLIVTTVVMSSFIAFTFFGLNAIGTEIEDPFGDDDNDLDLAEVAERVAVGSHTILSLRDESLNSESAHDLIKSFDRQLKNIDWERNHDATKMHAARDKLRAVAAFKGVGMAAKLMAGKDSETRQAVGRQPPMRQSWTEANIYDRASLSNH